MAASPSATAIRIWIRVSQGREEASLGTDVGCSGSGYRRAIAIS
jgi:hypothetical protein